MRTIQIILLCTFFFGANAILCAQSKPAEAQEAATANSPSQEKAKERADDASASDQPAPKPAPAKSKLDPNSSLLVELGYSDWALRGNETKFRQYATPPRGIFLRDFRYAPFLRSPSTELFFHLRGVGQDDYYTAGRGVWDYGATQISGFRARSRFFDPTDGPINPSAWLTEGINVKRTLSRDFSLTFQTRSSVQQVNFQVPYPPLDQKIDYWDAVAGGKLGRGYARLSFSNFHYADDTTSLQIFNMQKVSLSYQWNPLRSLGIELAGEHATINQPGLAESRVDTLSLGGDVVLSDSTDLAVVLQRRQLSLPLVQNAYARNQSSGTFSLNHRFKNWRAQVGLRLQNAERVNGDQTNVDVPKWSTLEGRLTGKLGPNIKLNLRGSTQALSNAPASVLSDPRTLYWTNRNFFQARLEGGTPDINGYLVYTYRVNSNNERSSNVTTEQYTVGSSWQISPNVNLFAEYHHENWAGRTDTIGVPALYNFLPDSDTGVVEVDWTLGSRAYMSLNFTGFSVYNDNPLLQANGNTRGSFFTINTRYRLSKSDEIGLIVAPWTYHDSVNSSMNYDTTVFMVTGSARF